MAINIQVDEKWKIEVQLSYDKQLHEYLKQLVKHSENPDFDKEDVITIIKGQMDELLQRIVLAEAKLIL